MTSEISNLKSQITKRPLAQACTEAEEFRALFPAETFERWEIAGSVRRRRPEVGDIEHVILPRIEMRMAGGLFPSPVNLVWWRLDQLVAAGTLAPARYQDGKGGFRGRWGELYRGVEFRWREPACPQAGFTHELFTADRENFGAILAIRTGPPEFSRGLVIRIAERGMKQFDGRVVYTRGPSSGRVFPCPSEELYFGLAGLAWVPPEERDAHDLCRMYPPPLESPEASA